MKRGSYPPHRHWLTNQHEIARREHGIGMSSKKDGDVHDKINGAKLLCTTLDSFFQAVEFAHVHSTNANDLGTLSGCGNVLGHALRLLDIATDDAGIGAEIHHRPDLRAANGACAAGAEDDLVRWGVLSIPMVGISHQVGLLDSPNKPSFQTSLIYSDLGSDMVCSY